MQRGSIHILVLVGIAGLISFLLISNLFSFRNSLFSTLFSKKGSFAQGTFDLVGTHPYAPNQQTPTGKTITTLFAWDNKVFLGYGDYGANSGPIQIVSFDPVSAIFSSSLIAAESEAINIYRSLGTSLYAPSIDSISSNSYIFAKGEPWVNTHGKGVNAAHIYDIATLGGNDLYIVGVKSLTGGGNATVWQSLDYGESWVEILSVAPISTVPGDIARFHFAASFNGKLYVQAKDLKGSPHLRSEVFDGSLWSDGPNLFSSYNGLGWKPQVFSGKLVYQSWEPPNWSYIMYFDGTKDTLINSFTVYDYTIDGFYLYALETSGEIKRTIDLSSWVSVATAPPTSRSLTILNNLLYVGTIDSKLYKYSKPMESIDESCRPFC